jgi:hypothetical protein
MLKLELVKEDIIYDFILTSFKLAYQKLINI